MDYKPLERLDSEKVENGTGKLAIHFEKLSHNSVPIAGCGIYEDEKDKYVVFFITWSGNYQDIALGKISYTLYQLNEESQKSIYDEHKRYEEEIGLNRTYGLKPNVKLFKSGKQMSKFISDVKISELRGNPLCNIDYKQVVNPTPYLEIPENISRAAVPDVKPKNPGSSGAGLCPNTISQIVSSASNDEFHWVECNHIGCLESLVSIILDEAKMVEDEKKIVEEGEKEEGSREIVEKKTYKDKREEDIYTLDEESDYRLKLTISLKEHTAIPDRYNVLRPALLKGGIHYLDRQAYHIVSREALLKNDEEMLVTLRNTLSTYKK